MSPGQVERFIGSCLISSGYKPPRYRRYPEYGYQPGWAGLPLIMGKKEDRSPLSRLAIHTQGAPLIQAGRGQARRGQKQQQKPPQKEVKETEAEPANSENSLPRIIKPRKRRKKERKPQQESAIVTLKPYTPLCSELPDEQQPSPGDGEELAECQCRYCDPLGAVWEAGTGSDSSWPSTEKEETRSSGNLEVSSQIVTSPNGHRDIEIRFFTSPPPQPQPVQRPVSVSPPWR